MRILDFMTGLGSFENVRLKYDRPQNIIAQTAAKPVHLIPIQDMDDITRNIDTLYTHSMIVYIQLNIPLHTF